MIEYQQYLNNFPPKEITAGPSLLGPAENRIYEKKNYFFC